MENVNGLVLDMVADLYKRAQEGERYYGETLDLKYEIQALRSLCFRMAPEPFGYYDRPDYELGSIGGLKETV